MSTVARSTQDVTVGPDLTQLDSLRPYASLQIVRHPNDAPCVDEILRALPPLLKPIAVDKLVDDIDELLPRDKRRPRWFGKVADLIGVNRRIKTPKFLTTLKARLRESSDNPPVSYANGRSASRGSDLAKRVCVLIGLDPALYHRRILMTLHPPGTAKDGLEVGALGYLEQRVPGWWSHDRPGPVDRLHQLVLVCRRAQKTKTKTKTKKKDDASQYLALYASEPAAKLRIAHAIGTDEPLDSFTRIDPQVLDDAFVKRDEPPPADHDAQRRIRTLWLSGIHPSAAWKADAKILMGHDLENALEPLADQTYYFSAARCSVPVAGDRLTVGVAPRRSSLWAGSVPSWHEFRDRTVKLLDHIASSEPFKGRPIAVLADQVEVKDAKEIAGAYDMSVICPELLAEDPDLDPDVRVQAERWAYNAHFFDYQKAKTGPAFTVLVAVDDAYVGALDIEFERSRSGWRPKVKRLPYKPPKRSVLEHESIVLMVPAKKGPGHDALEASRHKLHVEAAAVCRRPGWLTVRYDSGHTLSGGALFSTRYRDVEFKNWEWDDLSNRDYNIWQEKPMVDKATGKPVLEQPKKGTKTKFDLTRIGMDRSLFCWVKRNWPVNTPSVSSGWLACDDGAGEIADFIHLDPNPQDAGSPLLSLIHVKASHSRSPEREISTSDYEIVVGQAVKNLRSLDRINLAKGLADGAKKAIGKAVWKDGVKTTRRKMIDALTDLEGNYRRQVVIVQPRVTYGEYLNVKESRKAHQDTPRVRRMQQLDTLLVGAQAECRALQAELLVVGDSIAGNTEA